MKPKIERMSAKGATGAKVVEGAGLAKAATFSWGPQPILLTIVLQL